MFFDELCVHNERAQPYLRGGLGVPYKRDTSTLLEETTLGGEGLLGRYIPEDMRPPRWQLRLRVWSKRSLSACFDSSVSTYGEQKRLLARFDSPARGAE